MLAPLSPALAAPALLVASALAAAALLVACGPEPGAGAPGERGPAFFADALASVEATPDPLRTELLRTCDKWRHLDRPCNDEALRRDLLECWIDHGQGIFAWTEVRKMRPRARAIRTLTEVNVCLEKRRWRKVRPGPELVTKE